MKFFPLAASFKKLGRFWYLAPCANIYLIHRFPMHSGYLRQESLMELNLNRVTRDSEIGQHL